MQKLEKSGTGSYRYGFNGQERSTEIHENSYTAEFWEYDARLGRRWNVDPVFKEYESPYATFANNPVWFADPNGADTTINGIGYLDPVVVIGHTRNKLGKIWHKVGRFFSNVGENVKEIGKKTIIFATSAANAWGSNQMLGAGRSNPDDFGAYSDISQLGQTAGDALSIVTGSLEVVAAGGMEGGGLALDATGVGAVAGIPLNAAGLAVGAHGATVISTASANLVKDFVKVNNKQAHGSPSSGGGNYKKLSSNKSANDYAQSKGYKDAHELKRVYTGKGNESKFDIEVDHKTGRARLVTKDNKTIIDID